MRAQELNGELEILVVDGGSKDGSRDHRRARCARRTTASGCSTTPRGARRRAEHRPGRRARRVRGAHGRPHAVSARLRGTRGRAAAARGHRLRVGAAARRGRRAAGRAVALALQQPARRRRRQLPVTPAVARSRSTRGSAACGGAICCSGSEAGTRIGRSTRTPSSRPASEPAADASCACPQMAARYAPRAGLRGLARQYWRYGQYRAKTAGRHPDALRRSNVLAPGLVAVAASGAVPLRITRPARAGARAVRSGGGGRGPAGVAPRRERPGSHSGARRAGRHARSVGGGLP